MSNKTYAQFCGIAHALDTVGERWSLLVVRNLVAGEKRFSDLLRGLPGLSTNILTDRLKLLEAHGVITTRWLPPPAASTVYALTPDGWALIEVLTALARWGGRTLGPVTDEVSIGDEAVAFMVMGVFYHPTPPDFVVTCQVTVRHPRYSGAFTVRVGPGGAALAHDAVSSEPIVTLTLDLDVLSPLSGGAARIADLLADGRASLDGDPALTGPLVRWIDSRVP